MIPLSRPHVDEKVKAAALRALESGRYILREECRAFEAEFAAYIGTAEAVLTASGTAALALSMRALDISSGGEVLVPAHTAFPTVEAILLAGGLPVFVDVDEHFTMDPTDAARKVTSRTVGLLPVHLYGHPADLDPLLDLAEGHNLWLVEDAGPWRPLSRPESGWDRPRRMFFVLPIEEPHGPGRRRYPDDE